MGVMAYSADDYREQLRALLPRGRAWEVEEGDVRYRILDALAQELARCDALANSLLDEADPTTTLDLLPDWERVLALPDACGGLYQTLTQRRNAVIAKLRRPRVVNRQYWIDAAAALGHNITIEEFTQHTVESGVDKPLYDWRWLFAVVVHAPLTAADAWSVQDAVDQPLGSFGNSVLECALKRICPAHIQLFFAYT